MAFIIAAVLLHSVAGGIAAPVLPQLVISLSGGHVVNGAVVHGLFSVTFAAMQFVFSPVVGALSDRFGRRRIILLAQLGLGLDCALMAAAPTLWWLLAGRVIAGITSYMHSAAAACVADLTTPDERAVAFGRLGAAFGVGLFLGPAVGGLLSGWSLRAPFQGAAGLSLASAVCGYFLLPESLPPDRRARLTWRRAHLLASLQMLRSHPPLLALTTARFLSKVAADSIPAVFVLYTGYRYTWDGGTVGTVLAAGGLLLVLVQGTLVSPFVAALGERRAAVIGLALGAGGLLTFACAPTGAWFVAGVPFAVLWSLGVPPLQAFITRRVGPDAQGVLQGTQSSVNGAASMFAPLLFTQTFVLAINPNRGIEVPGLPFVVAAGLLVAAAVIVGRAMVTPAARSWR